MARIIGPLGSFSASKQLGKRLVFKNKKGRNLVTKYSKPGSKNPFTPSAAQVVMRGYMRDAREAWQNLSDANKQAWNDFVLPYYRKP